MVAGRGVGDLSNADFGVGVVDPGTEDAFGDSFNLDSGDDPTFRNILLKDDPDPALFPKALAIPLNALKALLDPVCELLGVVLVDVVGVDGEPNAGCPNADTGLPMELVWPNTEPGVAGTGIFGPEGCPPPNALTVGGTGFGFANGESLELKFDSPKPLFILRPMNALGTGGGPAGVVLGGSAAGLTKSSVVSGEVGAVELSVGD